MSRTQKELPKATMARMQLHRRHLPQLRAQLRGQADLLIDIIDTHGLASVRIARFAQPGGHIRRAIKETFG